MKTFPFRAEFYISSWWKFHTFRCSISVAFRQWFFDIFKMTQHLALFLLCFLNLCFVWDLPHFKMLADACCWKPETPPQTWGAQGQLSKGWLFWMTPRDGPFLSRNWMWCHVPLEKITVRFDPIFPSFLGIDFLGWESFCANLGENVTVRWVHVYFWRRSTFWVMEACMRAVSRAETVRQASHYWQDRVLWTGWTLCRWRSD